VSVLLVAAILMQKRGAGLGGVFGGEGSVYMTKRGAEKAIFIATIVLGVVFVLLLLASLVTN
jgi:preprotein translocase subunit SecG